MESTSEVPEAILVFGLYGGGKTHSWATTAEYYRSTHSPGTFYVIGTEVGAVGRLNDKYEDFSTNVVWDDSIWGWRDLDRLTKEYLDRAQPGDWIVVEGIDKAWQWVQELYDELHGPKQNIDLDDPFSMERNQDEVQRDWVKINKVYRSWINSIVRHKCHTFACSPQEQIRYPDAKKASGGWHDSKEVIEQYSRFGFRPAGQKELGHHFHTVLWAKNPSYQKWTLTTVDDHTREPLEDAPITSFPLDYLMKVAGWEL